MPPHSPAGPQGVCTPHPCQLDSVRRRESDPYQDPGTVTLGLRESLPNDTGGHMAARPTHFSHLSGERAWQQGRGMGPGRATILTGRPWPGKASKASPRRGISDPLHGRLGSRQLPRWEEWGRAWRQRNLWNARQELTRVTGSWLQRQRPDRWSVAGLHARAAGWVGSRLQGPGHLRQRRPRESHPARLIPPTLLLLAIPPIPTHLSLLRTQPAGARLRGEPPGARQGDALVPSPLP